MRDLNASGVRAFGSIGDRVSPPKLGGVAARKKKFQVPYAQTVWFPSRTTSRMHFETFWFGNHPVCGFAAATPPNLGGDTLITTLGMPPA
jgi:hypothetical protein